jgi:hypothetical protein
MSAGRTTLIVAGSVVAVLAAALVAAGGFGLWVDSARAGNDGYVTTDSHRVRTPTHAFVTEDIDIGSAAEWLFDEGRVIKLRVSAAADEPMFIGVARTGAVQAYLKGVAYDRVTDLEVDPFGIETERHPGAARPTPPAKRHIWAASAQGRGTQTLDWSPDKGKWSVVVMNADASRGVSTDVRVGFRVTHLFELGLGFVIGGALLLAGGAAMIVLGGRGPSGPAGVQAEPIPA